MNAGCPKIPYEVEHDEVERASESIQVLRRELWQDRWLLVLFLQLLLGQYLSARALPIGWWCAGALLGLLGGWRKQWCARSVTVALLLNTAALLVGGIGVRLTQPSSGQLRAVERLLDGAMTRRFEMELQLVGDIERRAVGAARATALAEIDGIELPVLVTLPEPAWSGRGFLAPGDRLRVIGKLRAARSEEGGVFGYGELLLRRGLVGSVRVVHVDALYLASGALAARERLLRQLRDRHELVDGLGVLAAGAFGVGDLLSERVILLFRETGLTHLLVVSGYHVGVIFGAIYGSAALFVRLCPRLVMLAPLPVVASTIAMVLGAAYVVFVGSTLTTVRALMSASVVFVGQMLGRRAASRRALLLVLLLAAMIWPGSAFEAGFQLTFAALAGLYYGGALGRCALGAAHSANDWRSRLWRQLCAAVFASAGATACTTPVMLCWFGSICPLALLFNLLAGGLFSLLFILVGGVLLLAWASGMPGADLSISALVYVAECYLNLLATIGLFVAQTPFAYRELEPEFGRYLGCGIALALAAVAVRYETVALSRCAYSAKSTACLGKKGVEKKSPICESPRPTTSDLSARTF